MCESDCVWVADSNLPTVRPRLLPAPRRLTFALPLPLPWPLAPGGGAGGGGTTPGAYTMAPVVATTLAGSHGTTTRCGVTSCTLAGTDVVIFPIQPGFGRGGKKSRENRSTAVNMAAAVALLA